MISSVSNFANPDVSFNRILKNLSETVEQVDHCCSRAKRNIYTCCVYRTSHGDYCLASD